MSCRKHKPRDKRRACVECKEYCQQLNELFKSENMTSEEIRAFREELHKTFDE